MFRKIYFDFTDELKHASKYNYLVTVTQKDKYLFVFDFVTIVIKDYRRNKMKKKVAFVCIHNSCRSQMAEGFANKFGSHIIEAYSAGTARYSQVKPLAVKVMEQSGIDMSNHYPKLLSDIPANIDILVTMGCGVECPYLPCSHREDWGLVDPSGGPIEGFENTRDIIKEKVLDLIKRVENGDL